MGEIKQQKLITVPENNKSFKGLGFGRWDTLVADYLAEHSDCQKDKTPSAKNRKKGKRKNAMQ